MLRFQWPGREGRHWAILTAIAGVSWNVASPDPSSVDGCAPHNLSCVSFRIRFDFK